MVVKKVSLAKLILTRICANYRTIFLYAIKKDPQSFKLFKERNGNNMKQEIGKFYRFAAKR